jgi:hypothetical protein
MYLSYYLIFYLFLIQAKFWDLPWVIRLSLVIFTSLIVLFLINYIKNYFDNKKFVNKKAAIDTLRMKLEYSIQNVLPKNNYNSEKNLDDLKFSYKKQFQHLYIQNSIPNSKPDNKIIAENLNNHEPFKFLDESFNNEFTVLDGILVHQFLLAKAQTGHLPMLSRWVRKGQNNEFRKFMINEIAFFNQKGCASILASLLASETDCEIKIALINSLTKLNYKQSEAQIIACYKCADIKLRNVIINAVILFKSKYGLKFLNDLFFDSQDQNFKDSLILAMKIMRDDISNENNKINPNTDSSSINSIAQYNYQII